MISCITHGLIEHEDYPLKSFYYALFDHCLSIGMVYIPIITLTVNWIAEHGNWSGRIEHEPLKKWCIHNPPPIEIRSGQNLQELRFRVR